MSNPLRRLSRVAPGTAYTTGNDIATAITPKEHSILRVNIAMSAAGVLSERVGGVDLALNEGVPLAADTEYTFYVEGGPEDTISFRYSVTGTIRKFIVNEVDEGVA